MRRTILSWFAMGIATAALAADSPVPSLGFIGEEEVVSYSYMERPAIAADSLGQPHMVCDAGGDTRFMKYHRIDGAWSGGIFAVGARGGRYDASRLYIGQIEIDSRNRAWISCKFGVKEYGNMYGQGIWLFKNVTTAPKEQFFRFVCVYKGMGVVTTDAKYPDQGVVIGTFGNYAILYSSGQTLGTGSINCGPGGEKVRARIASFAPRFDPAPGTDYPDGIWHTAMNGYSAASSRYQNTARYKAGRGPVEWAAYSAYPQQGSDFSHPGLGVDLVNPQICYLGSVFNGRLCLNIWNGSAMLFPSANLKVIDFNATYEVRHGPSFAPAPGGGTFVFWTSAGRIKAAFVSPAGEVSPPVDITAGRSPAATTDRFGNLHLAYYSGGARYRQILVSSLDPLAPKGRITATRTPAFVWSDTRTNAYTLALTRDGAALPPFSVETNTWTPPADLPTGSYAWMVREGDLDASTPWSRPLAFLIPPAMPVPLAPLARLSDAPAAPVFEWNCPDPTVTRFKIELFRDSDYLGAASSSESGLAWANTLPAGIYSWRMKAFRDLDGYTLGSDWTPLGCFQLAVPGPCQLVEPASLATFQPGLQPIACSWTAADEADSYTLTLLFNGTPLAVTEGLTGTNHVLSRKFLPGYHTVLVQPVNAAGTGAPSPARTFVVDRVMAPGTKTILSQAPTLFTWTRSKFTQQYLLKLSRYDESAGKFLVVLSQWVPQAKGMIAVAPAHTFTAGAYRWTVTDYNGATPGFTSVAYFGLTP
ncbi:MAG: hypothetical protein R6X19_11570 [Kiritimatiellia bacterium]